MAVKTLSAQEFEVLSKIAQKTKMDCWFSIKQSRDSDDLVYDLEGGSLVPLELGISQLMEGLDCQENFDSCCLTNSEKLTLKKLLEKLSVTAEGFDWKLT